MRPLAKQVEEQNVHLFAIRLFFESIDEDYIPNYIAVTHTLGCLYCLWHI